MVKKSPANPEGTRSMPGPAGSRMPGATKPLLHNHWGPALEFLRREKWPLLAATRESPRIAKS